MAEPIVNLFGGLTRADPRNHVLDGGRSFTRSLLWAGVQPTLD